MLGAILIAITLFYSSINGDDLLAKFHQNTYQLKEYRVEIESYDKDHFSKAHTVTFKYNRSTTAINATVSLKKDLLAKNIEVLVQFYKFASNEYRRFPIRFQKGAREMMYANVLGAKSVFTCGNITTDINFYKGMTYHLCNFIPDATLFPPLIPTGRYKVKCGLLYPVNEIAVAAAYFEIFIPFKYDKK